MSPEQALSRLSHLCSHSEKSVFDIRKKLLDWDFPSQEAEIIIKKLQLSGFVDDRRYTKAFVHDKSTLARWGVRKIHNALKNKQIDNAIINEALAGLDNSTVKETLVHLFSVKKKSIAALPLAEQKIKLLRFALNRGYSYEEACEAMNN
ncbi:MAG: recombination regulator RecX [Prevotellaceae bacterium]|jgi:regulatory protein|nr:recombination regulator RecX [Prevotellaceae bacterium]